jgi:transcriptional regulator with XRE-family HTH domain
MGNMMFGEGMRLLRRARGVTQTELAQHIRVNRHQPTASYISRIEHGQLDPRLSTICAIARALRVKPWQVLAYPERADWWQAYLSLPPIGKREVQRVIRWYGERRSV